MAYEFKQDGKTLSETVESFWLYTSFDVSQVNEIAIKAGFMAVYFSQQPPVKGGSGPTLTRPSREHIKTCEITSPKGQSISMNNLSLLYSRLHEYRNERGYLHLYRFDSYSLPDWISTQWYNEYQITPNNDDQTELMERTLDFGGVKGREVFYTSVEESGEAVMALTVATPFLGSHIMGEIIQANKKEFPKLTLNSKWHGQSWEFPSPADQVRDSAKEGWVMITEGAFSALPLSASLDGRVNLGSWAFNDQSGGADVMQRLSDLVYAYPTENSHGGIRRFLFNAQESGASSVVKTTKHPPYEIFHLRDINDERMSKIVSDTK